MKPTRHVTLASVFWRPNGGPGQGTRGRENVCPYVFHVSHRRKCVFVSGVSHVFTFSIEGRVTFWRQKTRNTQNLEAPVKEHKAGRTCVFTHFTFPIEGRVTLRRQKARKTQKRAYTSSLLRFMDFQITDAMAGSKKIFLSLRRQHEPGPEGRYLQISAVV